MKLGTQFGFAGCLNLSEAEGYRLMAEHGFSSVDFSLMNNHDDPMWSWSDEQLKAYMTERREIMNANGIVAGQTHAPMDAYWYSAPETKKARWDAQIQAIKAASYLKSPYIVVHPLTPPFRIHDDGVEETKELNMEFYNFLKPYLEEYGVKAAIENIPSYDFELGAYCETTCSSAAELIDYLDTLNSECFVACLDVGHAALANQDPVKMIYQLGKKYLHVTHMHDNNRRGDDHMMPGLGGMDWRRIGKALNDIGFDGVFNYEADSAYAPLYYLPNNQKAYMDLFRLFAELGKAIINSK